MRIRPLVLGPLLVLCGVVVGASLQEGAQEPLGAPGEMHAELARHAGKYTTKNYLRMSPDGDPVVSEGESELAMALGGRFLVETSTGDMMGQPYEIVRWWGFNTGSEEFESAWVWTNSTSILSLRGTPAEEQGRVDWVGAFRDENGAEKTLHVVTRAPDDDHVELSILEEPEGGGERFEVWRTEFTRKKE